MCVDCYEPYLKRLLGGGGCAVADLTSGAQDVRRRYGGGAGRAGSERCSRGRAICHLATAVVAALAC